MRDAFKAQYMSQFTASEDTTWEKTNQKSDYGVVKANSEGGRSERGGSGSSGRSSNSNSSGGTTLSSGTYLGGAPMKSAYSGFVSASSSSNDSGSSNKSESRKKKSRWDND